MAVRVQNYSSRERELKEFVFPSDLQDMIKRVENAFHSLPNIYKEHLYYPLITNLRKLEKRQNNLNKQELKDHYFEVTTCVLAILQNIEPHQKQSLLKASQQIIVDINKTFVLRDEGISGFTEKEGIPPLLVFNNLIEDVEVCSSCDLKKIGVTTKIISIPTDFDIFTLFLSLSVFPFEFMGYKFLQEKVCEEIKNKVSKELKGEYKEYLLNCLESVTVDLLMILNLGSDGAAYFIEYLRSLNEGFLSNLGVKHKPFLIDFIRGMIVTKVVDYLDQKEVYNNIMYDISRDFKRYGKQLLLYDVGEQVESFINIEEFLINLNRVIETVLTKPLDALQGKTFLQIRKWDDSDDRRVDIVKEYLLGKETGSDAVFISKCSASHVIVAGIQNLKKVCKKPVPLFKIIEILEKMFEKNDIWSVDAKGISYF